MLAKTYDIINAGPHNRFMANGRIVSNSGRLFQPQNLMRPTLPQKEIDFGIEALKSNCADLFYDNAMELAANVIRGCIIAPPGKKLCVSDLSGIEGRVLPWLAGEQWSLDAYAWYDTFKLDVAGQRIPDGKGGFLREGADSYVLTYSKAFHVPMDKVTKSMRQIGKVMTLLLGYQGSVGAFVTGAATYKIDLAKLADGLIKDLAPKIRETAENSWEWAVREKRTLDLPKETYVVCRAITEMWRAAHPQVVTFWDTCQKAAIQACENRGELFRAGGRVSFIRSGNWLRAILPSGRSLCYAGPRFDPDKNEFSYFGINQYSRKWCRLQTYAGKWAEQLTQGTARDILTHNMLAIETAGYEIVTTIHDEVVAEAPDSSEFSHEHLSSLLATPPDWAEGLPLAAAGYESYRYRKDG